VPHTATNFIMKEMGYAIGRAHARRLQQLCMLLLDIAFFACLLSPKYNWLVFIVAPALLAAAWLERWLFFAQAQHVSQLFYGMEKI
jgi:DMSO reductase anchor subunit